MMFTMGWWFISVHPSLNTVETRSHVISLIFSMFLSSIDLSSFGISFVVKKVWCGSLGSLTPEKIWILRVGKIINIFSFMRIRRRNFYLVFIRISVVLDKFPFLPFPQTCEYNKKCCGLGEDVDDHRF